MQPHHSKTIQNVKEYFERDPEVQALLLSGSIAHGFESSASDVDIMIFVSEVTIPIIGLYSFCWIVS